MSPVRFVFDVKDTEGEPFPPPNQRPDGAAAHLTEELFENTVHNCALHGIMVHQVETDGHATGSSVSLSADVSGNICLRIWTPV
jgi:hypothetical protein